MPKPLVSLFGQALFFPSYPWEEASPAVWRAPSSSNRYWDSLPSLPSRSRQQHRTPA